MTLQNGLKVVHKTHGVGEIIGTESMDFGGVMSIDVKHKCEEKDD